MNVFFRPRKLAAALALTLAALLLPAQAARAACLSPAEARAVVASGQAAPLGPIVASLRRQAGVDVINGELCSAGGGFVYQLTVLGPGGRVRRLVVDARSGQIR